MVKALAWPITAVIVAVMFRTEVRNLIRRLSKMKYKDAEAEFREGLSEVTKHVEAGAPAIEEKNKEPRPLSHEDLDRAAAETLAYQEKLFLVARASPRAGILEAWVGLEAALLSYLAVSSKDPSIKHLPDAIRVIGQMGVLPKDWLQAIQELRQLKNRAAHDADFTPSADDAKEFISLASSITGYLRHSSERLTAV